MSYINKSFKKLKDDLLSKGIYDVIKWIFISLILLLPSRWIPLFKELIYYKISLSIYWLSILIIILIGFTILVTNYVFRQKIQAVVRDNFTDDLTGLKNHKALAEYLNQKILESKKNNAALSLILLDIDDFKRVNTEAGYNIADQLLKKIGELLGNDKRATDETFRYFQRGDEFLVVTTETSLSQAIQAAERKRILIYKSLFSVDGDNFKLTVSCGVTELKKEDDYNSFTNRVIMALNEAKKIPKKNNTKSIL
ncbi:GGDEF domain-containing protein [Chryseobacterium sp. sg2396]|uniref:GGDEF domain-containing protein n=1 Tax=Chryseobacterium sp. sg2396 TaxID=3276280 RepID=UPI00366BA3F3